MHCGAGKDISFPDCCRWLLDFVLLVMPRRRILLIRCYCVGQRECCSPQEYLVMRVASFRCFLRSSGNSGAHVAPVSQVDGIGNGKPERGSPRFSSNIISSAPRFECCFMARLMLIFLRHHRTSQISNSLSIPALVSVYHCSSDKGEFGWRFSV